MTDPARSADETDEALFARFRRTLEDAPFDALVARHASRAYAVAYAFLHEAAAAEDAVQEALLRLVRARGRFRPGRSFAQWFYALLRNCCRDELRRRLRSPVEAEAPPDPAAAAAPGSAADPLGEAEARERARAAWRAFRALPQPEQEVLALRIHAGLDFGQIAAVCGLSVEAAKKRAYRVLERLRRELSDSA